MKTKHLGIAACLLASILTLRAQVFEISPFYGYRFGGTFETGSGQDTDLDPAPSFGLSLDFAPNQSDVVLELLWSHQETGLDLDPPDPLDWPAGPSHLDMNVDEFMLGGLYEHGRGRFHETVTALVGATVFSPEAGDTEARFTVSLGVGMKYFLLKNLALRADLRGYMTYVESDSAFISTGGRTVVYFTGSTIWQGEISGGLTLAF